VSHDAVPDSGPDALSHDGSPGADALRWYVFVLRSLVRDDRRLWLDARWSGGSSRGDRNSGCACGRFDSACMDRCLSCRGASKSATTGPSVDRHRLLGGARHLSLDPPPETLTLPVADRCLHAKRVRARHRLGSENGVSCASIFKPGERGRLAVAHRRKRRICHESRSRSAWRCFPRRFRPSRSPP